MKKLLTLFLLIATLIVNGQNVTVNGPPSLTLYSGYGVPTGLIKTQGTLYLQGGGTGGYLWINTNGTATGWVQLANVNQLGATAWSLTGNAGTTPVTNFIGTTDNNSFRIRTDDTLRMIVDSLGNVGIATTTPVAAFDANYHGSHIAQGDLTALGLDTNTDYIGNINNGNGTFFILAQGAGAVHLQASQTMQLQTPALQIFTPTLLPDVINDSSTVFDNLFSSGITYGTNTLSGWMSNFANYLWGGASSIIGNVETGIGNNSVLTPGIQFNWLHDNCHVDSNTVNGYSVIWDINDACAENCYVVGNILTNHGTYQEEPQLDDIMQRSHDYVINNQLLDSNTYLGSITQLAFSLIAGNILDANTDIGGGIMYNSRIDSNNLHSASDNISNFLMINSAYLNDTAGGSGFFLFDTVLNRAGATAPLHAIILNAPTLISGAFQYTGSSPASGKVLTSDASGNASWRVNTPALDSVQIYALTGVATGQTYFCSDCSGNIYTIGGSGLVGGLVTYTGSLWRRNF